MTNDELPTWLSERVRREPADSLSPAVVPGSAPVVCFGDQRVADVATLGINPSAREFTDGAGRLLRGEQRRLHTAESLGGAGLADVTDAQVQALLEGCYGYFDRNPYWPWFVYLGSAEDRAAARAAGVRVPSVGPDGSVLDAVGASYMGRTACHLDLVQWATSPVYGQLEPRLQRLLLAADAAFLVKQLTWDRPGQGRLRLVLVNGLAAQKQCGAVGVPWQRVPEQLVVDGRPCTFWFAEWNGVRMVAWSTNLPYYAVYQPLREAVPEQLGKILSDLGW